MPKSVNSPVYPIVTGRVAEGRLTEMRTAGYAYYIPEEGFYLLRLSMFGQNRYYLKKNQASQTHYTIYADYLRETDHTRFREPVGCARLSNSLRTHLEIRFPLLARSLYMDLFPDQGEENN